MLSIIKHSNDYESEKRYDYYTTELKNSYKLNLNPGFNSIKQNPSPDIIENEFNLRLGINSKIHFFPLTLKPLEDNNNTFKNNFYDNQGTRARL